MSGFLDADTVRTPAIVTTATSSEPTPLQSLLAELRVRGSGRGSMLGINFTSALEALWENRLRSGLTILGIFIGVAAVIAALTLTQGTGAYIGNLIGQGGTNITIYAAAAKSGGVSQGRGTSSSITAHDVQALTRLPHVAALSPINTLFVPVIYGGQNWSTQVEGVTTDLQSIQNWQLASGSWFSANDQDTGTPTAVLGDTVYHNLFDASGHNPIGQNILIRDSVFHVVGVVAPQGGFFTQDDVIFIPLKAAQIRLNNTPNLDQVLLSVDDQNNVTQAQQSIEATLRQDHHLHGTQADDFGIFSALDILQSFGQETGIITGLLVGIAAISLTVGGIGIMNIMLVSVTERTWEIGIRMSIGARRSDIRNQFLIEALVLCLVGGMIGLAFGLLIGKLVTGLTQLPFVITATTLILPFAVAAGIALVFGLYPAIQASRLDPIVAIRSDE